MNTQIDTGRRHLAIGGLLALACLTAPPLAAAQSEATPASPEDGLIAVSAEFRFPRRVSAAEAVTVNCQVLVGTDGAVAASKCSQRGGSERFRAWIRNELYFRLERARFRPAQVNGEAVAVSMALRAEARCSKAGECTIDVYPNGGMHADDLGDDYTSPQEIVGDDGTWYDRLIVSPSCDGGAREACKEVEAFAFAAGAVVDAQGSTVGIGLMPDYEATAFPAEAALQQIVETRFIPARRAGGEPMELLTITPTLHSPGNPHMAQNQCLEREVTGQRLPERRCYTLQAYAALLPDRDDGWGNQINFWVRP